MGWRDAPIVNEQARLPAWKAAPVVGGGAPVDFPTPEDAAARRPILQRRAELEEAARPTQMDRLRGYAHNLGQGGLGLAEVGGSLATGTVAAPLALARGAEESLRGGEGRLQRTMDATRGTQDFLTYRPHSEAGQQMMGALAAPFAPLAELSEGVAGTVARGTGSEGAGAAAFLATEAAPALLGIRPRALSAGRRADVQRVTRGAEDLGVDLGAGVQAQRGQIAEAGRRFAPGASRGEAIPDVVTGMRREARLARDYKNELYAAADRTRAGVRSSDVQQNFLPVTQQIRRDFIVEEMPRANRLLQEVEDLAGLDPNSYVTLNAMERWHKKANRTTRGMKRGSDERTAIETAIRAKEDFLDTRFNADMISGDPNAIAAWRRARGANRDYRARFRDEKVIRDMIDIEAQPTTVRQWIFGANAAGARTEAATFVNRIKRELGEDSPEFSALRHDAALDLMQPLFRPAADGGPDLAGFVHRYDEQVRRNRPLAEALYGENLSGLSNLRDIAQAHRGRPVAVAAELPGVSRFLAVGLFGHELAKGALRRAGAEAVINTVGRAANQGTRRRMVGEILGYDAAAPVFGAWRGARGLGATNTLMQEARQDGSGVLDDVNPATRRTLERLGVRGGP